MNSTKILILEDHPMTRQMLVLALQGLGYTNVHTADCGKQAFALLKHEGHFDVLICDIQMHGIDGLTFLREAAEIGYIAALIISSAIAPDLRLAIQQLARLTGYQVLGDLGKPFTRDELKVLMLRYCPSAPHRAPPTIDELPSATEIQSGLNDGEFIPFYQPKLNLQTLEVIGMEVLVRWQHPLHGLISPGLFLGAVRHFGFLNVMTQTIARQALSFLREQRLIGELRLSINVETEQLARPDLLEAVRQNLDAERVPAQSLILEITESGLMQAPITSIENLVRLRLLGCGVSIDDFGAGFSSLQRVCEMPCSELKLDMSFIRSMTHNPRSLAAVDSLLRLSDNLGIQLVAEGIETHEQLTLLQRLGCQIGQGYVFARPLPGPEFMDWLHQHKQARATQKRA
ncbi:diguanylate phosphodiesterase [Pseudomonas laurylsulfatiphila]|jgi:EAL domain-containing protein (putative c-di-GMP-specific phosphodiesterase class I)|uniref:Diguanylate phosphodiesterase n=1 Tax=Pseudomonas laurylsulfatiphila TaxID=2011015 RepID=A0A2S6FH66_9PSED|nr:EAL domain-containing response regulator [Pseudomonas laurylsulfatiphila]PPK36740.1 diguanylate phosphodiesterase [Pseudomonas laurylsulfatiphila]